MKKIIILSVFVMGVFASQAQTTVQGSKFFDNWSIEISGGAVTPFTHSAIFKNARPAYGLGFTKQITPVFGVGFQGTGYSNSSLSMFHREGGIYVPYEPSSTAVDFSDVSALAKINLMNLFGGYKGVPRLFDIETVTGIGWLHTYVPGEGDQNTWSSRVGLNFNFNLGESKAWTIGIKPALQYRMNGNFEQSSSGFDANHAALELTAGIKYHFKSSNGKHHFTTVRAYDQAEIDRLNSSINGLRSDVNEKDGQIDNANQKITKLQSDLDACLKKPAEQVKVVEVKSNRIPESVVTFRQGKSVVEASQLPNVERVASYLKKYTNTKVVIKGYASPEGSIEVNERIAKTRAEAVKAILVDKYKISATRITAEGQGVGDMFSEPEWNRVSICTIEESK